MLATLALLVAASAPAVPSSMTYELQSTERSYTAYVEFMDTGRRSIYARGTIDPGAADRLQRLVQEHDIGFAIVYFDSPGGSVVEGLKLGELLRRLKFDTGVGTLGTNHNHVFAGTCASACAYAYAGGLNRFYNGEQERLGLHQFYAPGSNVGHLGEAQVISAVLVSYLERMGVEASAFAVASVTPGHEMLWLDKEQALALRLADNGEKPTTAEVKLSGQHPYLKLEQSFATHASRVLLNCVAPSVIRVSAGLVLDPEGAASAAASTARSYLEFDGREVQTISGGAGVSATESVMWIERTLASDELATFVRSNELGLWTENGSDFRNGATMDLRPVRQQVTDFVRNCVNP